MKIEPLRIWLYENDEDPEKPHILPERWWGWMSSAACGIIRKGRKIRLAALEEYARGYRLDRLEFIVEVQEGVFARKKFGEHLMKRELSGEEIYRKALPEEVFEAPEPGKWELREESFETVDEEYPDIASVKAKFRARLLGADFEARIYRNVCGGEQKFFDMNKKMGDNFCAMCADKTCGTERYSICDFIYQNQIKDAMKKSLSGSSELGEAYRSPKNPQRLKMALRGGLKTKKKGAKP